MISRKLFKKGKVSLFDITLENIAEMNAFILNKMDSNLQKMTHQLKKRNEKKTNKLKVNNKKIKVNKKGEKKGLVKRNGYYILE